MKPTPRLISRRSMLKATAFTTVAGVNIARNVSVADTSFSGMPNGRINHSVCRWCYPDIPLDDLCREARAMGITAIDLVGPAEWPVLKRHGLYAAMPHGAGMGIENGFNDPSLHDQLVESYAALIPQVAEAGYDKLICFSGNRRGLDDEQGLRNCAAGLKRLMPLAEQHGVTLVMELLNSKVDHPDYQCDHTSWGVALCDAVGSDRFKLLYDIYHMQIMEGDIIATIRKYHHYIAHYHTGGVPGRNELDETQELYYPAIMQAIADTGYTGYVAQEFIPKGPAPLASLRDAIRRCHVD